MALLLPCRFPAHANARWWYDNRSSYKRGLLVRPASDERFGAVRLPRPEPDGPIAPPLPDSLILDFFQRTDEVGATVGVWGDRAALERPSLASHRKGARR